MAYNSLLIMEYCVKVQFLIMNNINLPLECNSDKNKSITGKKKKKLFRVLNSHL